jgi:hypothetical protein
LEEDNMSKKHIGIIVSGIVIMATLTGCVMSSGCLEWVGLAGEWKHDYDYCITITPDKTIYNMTLYLPVLMLKGEVHYLVFDAINKSKPSNWLCNVIDTEYGKMLRISADIIAPEYYSIKIRKETTHTINTKNPTGNEPLFYPRINDTDQSYNSYIYAEYNTSTDTNVVIYMGIQGSNERGVLGGTQLEQYEDKIGFYTIKGESHSWHVVNGIFRI